MLIKILAIILMNVTLRLDTRETIDLMLPPKLDTNSDIVLSQQRERDEFKRTVEDVKLVVSDQDNKLTEKFRSYPVTSVWDVLITDTGRQLFRGRIERPISTDVRDEWLNIQCWSKNKDFWDKAKVTRINKLGTGLIKIGAAYLSLYVSVQDLLIFNLEQFKEEGLFAGYSIDALYSTRQIRWYYDTTDPAIGNDGRYEFLDPQTTIFDLLTAMSQYYNAEFFIDPEADLLTMIKRNSIQNDREHNLDEMLINTEPIGYDDTDLKKYDYLHSAFVLSKPSGAVTEMDVVADGSSTITGNQFFYYLWTYVISTGSSELESEASDSSALFGAYNISGITTSNYRVDMNVPLGPDGTIKRRVYKYVRANEYRMVGEIADNTTRIFSDKKAVTDILQERLIKLTPVQGDIYYRFDESLGTWQSLIVYDNSQVVAGKIFDIFPKLNFTNPDGTPKTQTIATLFMFFGRELNLDTFAQQWQDFFIYKGKIYCTVKNLPYRVGDSFVTTKHPKIPAGKYVCKNAGNQLMREQTKLELIKV